MNFLNELKRMCDEALQKTYLHKERLSNEVIDQDNFDVYQIYKKQGDNEKLIFTGLTLKEAKIVLNNIKPRFNIKIIDNQQITCELEIYKLTVNGKERYVELPQPRFNPETVWIG